MGPKAMTSKQIFYSQFHVLANSTTNDEQVDRGIRNSVQAMKLCHAADDHVKVGSSAKQPHSSPSPHSERSPTSWTSYQALAPPILPGTLPQPNSTTGSISINQGGVTTTPRTSSAQLESSVKFRSGPVAAVDGSAATRRDSSSVKEKPSSKMAGKRKRILPASKVPDCHRFFSGLTFLFVPNNDIAPARRMRIQKVVDYGGELARQWDLSVTHIVVDKDLTFLDVLKYVQLPELPNGIVLVNESYPAECISWRSVVPPTQGRFQVNGYEGSKITESVSSNASDLSLQIKSDKGLNVISERHKSLRKEECKVEVSKENDEPLSIDDCTELQDMTPINHDVSNVTSDSFEEAVASAKATAHLPLDSDEEDHGDIMDESSEASDAERSPQVRRKPEKNNAAQGSSKWQEKFQCMKSHIRNQDPITGPNDRIIAVLQDMQNYYHSIQDQWRSRGYRLAIATLRKQTSQITTREEAEVLPFIGERLAAKIEEIFWTNKLRRLENAKLEPDDKALQLFLNVYGAGFIQASKWVRRGYKTLDDLMENARLTPNQKIGIEHYNDFRTRIPRAETAQLGDIVHAALVAIDPAFESTIGGSYRRGAQDSGDIDMIVTKKGASAAELRTVVLEILVPQLRQRGFLVAALAVTDRVTGSKWHGVCQLPLGKYDAATVVNDPTKNTNPWRRIDFLLVPEDELGAAMIYFTGNDIFNRSMRLLARKKGMRLNQRGLYKDVLRRGSVKLTEGTKIEGASERGIFRTLGVPWREAWERDI